MRKLLTLSILFTFFTLTAASASEVAPPSWKVYTPCGETSSQMVLKLQAEIRKPLAEELRQLTSSCQNLDSLELRLDSPGGSIVEAAAIVDVLDQLKQKGVQITTRVNNGDECDSSCVPLFAQGHKRQAGPVAAFMFHGVAVYMLTNIPDPGLTQNMLSMIQKADGLSSAWLNSLKEKNVFSVPSMYWLSGQELMDQKSGLVTELLVRQELAKPYDRSYRQGGF